MKRLKFEKAEGDRHYIVINKKKQILGQVAFDKDDNLLKFYSASSPMSLCWFTEDCHREIADFMKGLRD